MMRYIYLNLGCLMYPLATKYTCFTHVTAIIIWGSKEDTKIGCKKLIVNFIFNYFLACIHYLCVRYFYIDSRVAGDLYKSSNFWLFVRPCVRSSVALSFSKLVITSPPKPLNGLCSNFQAMFLDIPSCASTHYFSNMSVRLSINQLSISLSYFH